MRALILVAVAACSRGGERRESIPRVVTLTPAPGPEAPDAEIIVGVLPDMHTQLDVAQQLADQLALRVPDVLVTMSATPDEGIVLDHPIDHGFARVRWSEPTLLVDAAWPARAMIDVTELRHDAALAIVRVRRTTLALDIIAADGVLLQ